MKRFKGKPKTFFPFLFLALGIFLFWRGTDIAFSPQSLFDVAKGLKDIEIIDEVMILREGFPESQSSKVLLPPPLRLTRESSGNLTIEGVLFWTNQHRADYSLSPLFLNPDLIESAEFKAEDMFDKQYFAHYSPSGEGIGDLMQKAGYTFLLAGENLAMGDFDDDESLVQGWMDSPGHRENILSQDFQEIGIAVQKGLFEGRESWMAVQHFGLPISVCQSPDQELKENIDINKNTINIISDNMDEIGQELKDFALKRGRGYSQLAQQYNALVSQYNSLIKETELLIGRYNVQVAAFNDCLSAFQD